MNRVSPQRAALHRLTEALAQSLAPNDFYRIVAEEACRLTNAGSAALCLLDEGEIFLDFIAAAGENAGEVAGLRIRVQDSLSEPVIETGRPYLKDARTDPKTGSLFSGLDDERFDPDKFPFSALNSNPSGFSSFSSYSASVLSAAVTPIFQNEKVIGTLIALNKERTGAANGASPPCFDQEDIDNLAILSDMAALSISSLATNRKAKEQERELEALYDAAKTVSGSLNVQEVMDSFLTAVCSHMEYHSAALFLLNDDRTHLFIAAERGLVESEKQVQLSVDFGAHHETLSTGISRLINNVDLVPDFQNLSNRIEALSAMISPVRSRNEIHGILMITSLQRNAYLESDLKLVDAVAMQAGIAMENAWLFEDAQRQAKEATSLYALSQHINEILNLDYVLTYAADNVMNILNADSFALLLYDEKLERLTPRVIRELDPKFMDVSLKVGQGIAGWVYEWQTPQAVSEVASDPRNKSAPLESFGAASLLCVPMQLGEDAIGVMMVMANHRRHFTVSEMELLYTIANQTAAAAVNAMLYKEARARTHEMSQYFRRVAHAIGNSLESHALPKLLTELAVEIMRADRCSLYRVEGENLVLEASSRFRSSSPPDPTLGMGEGFAGWVAKRGQSLTLSNLQEDLRSAAHAWLKKDHLNSYLAVPLKAGRHIVGVIEIYTLAQRDFTKDEVQLLSTFARRSKVAEKMIGALVVA